MNSLDLSATPFVYQGEIKFGSREAAGGLDDERTGGAASSYFKIFTEEKKKENASRELKSIYFGGSLHSSYYENENRVSLLKLVIHKNESEVNQSVPFRDGMIDEANVYNQVSVLAVNCMGWIKLKNPVDTTPQVKGSSDARFEDLLVYDKMLIDRVTKF